MHDMRVSLRRVRALSLLMGCLLGAVACNDLSGLAGVQSLPTGTPDPKSLRTAQGAVQLYNAVVSAFGQGSIGTLSATHSSDGAFLAFLWTSGLLADEFTTGTLATSPHISGVDLVDARNYPDPGGEQTYVYAGLQGIRGGASEAIGSLAAYDDSAVALRGHLYALRGYADVFLADLFCSGVPLSTLDFNGNYTYGAPSTTAQVYQVAIANFDTALTLSGDSARFMNLARVGKGRAYLALGQYDSAAAAVTAVPDSFVYSFPVVWEFTEMNGLGSISDPVILADTEGRNGLPFLSNGDPRDSVVLAGNNVNSGAAVYWPVKYGGARLDSGATTPVAVASGIEARLIQAEAAYHGVAAGTGTWLDQLNALRQAHGLPADLTMPATPDSQVTLLFRERAYWLYVTGHRQGDLRRLIRNYSRPQNAVYPTGPYHIRSLGAYGADVDLVIPTSETTNPLFHGCLGRGE